MYKSIATLNSAVWKWVVVTLALNNKLHTLIHKYQYSILGQLLLAFKYMFSYSTVRVGSSLVWLSLSPSSSPLNCVKLKLQPIQFEKDLSQAQVSRASAQAQAFFMRSISFQFTYWN